MSIKNILSFIIALVGAVAFVVIVGLITNVAYEPIKGKGSGYTLPEPEVAQISEASTETKPTEASAPTTPTTIEQPVASEAASLASLLANADINAGEKFAKKCAACHSFKPEKKITVGPPLYDIVGQPLAYTEGYKYSKIMLELASEGKVWSYENLNAFLIKPKDFAPKTKMSYSGIKSDEDRANFLLYLQSLSDNPVPLPTE